MNLNIPPPLAPSCRLKQSPESFTGSLQRRKTEVNWRVDPIFLIKKYLRPKKRRGLELSGGFCIQVTYTEYRNLL